MPGVFRFAGDDALRKRRGKAAGLDSDGLAQLDRPQSALYQERSQRLAELGVLLTVLFAVHSAVHMKASTLAGGQAVKPSASVWRGARLHKHGRGVPV